MMLGMDPVEQLVHEHEELTQLLSHLGELVEALDETVDVSSEQCSQLADVATELHDGMLSHFAAEEEVVFPFLIRHLMELSDRVAILEGEHDGICGALVRLTFLLYRTPSDGLPQVSEQAKTLFSRLDKVYRQHVARETEALERATVLLTPAQREVLLEQSRGLL